MPCLGPAYAIARSFRVEISNGIHATESGQRWPEPQPADAWYRERKALYAATAAETARWFTAANWALVFALALILMGALK